jgi:hypothetical protein
MTETTNQTHAVKLSRFLFKAADQQHVHVKLLEDVRLGLDIARQSRTRVARAHLAALRLDAVEKEGMRGCGKGASAWQEQEAER